MRVNNKVIIKSLLESHLDMTELKETGYMHKRMRKVVSQFLTKNLFID